MNRNQYISLFKEIFGNVSWIGGCNCDSVNSNNPNNIFACMVSTITNADSSEKLELLKSQESLITEDMILENYENPEHQISNSLVIFNLNEKELNGLLKCIRYYQDKFGFQFIITGKFNGFVDIENALNERMRNALSLEINTSIDQTVIIGLLKFIQWLEVHNLSLDISNTINQEGVGKSELVWTFEDNSIIH